jgi:hypothetical protein
MLKQIISQPFGPYAYRAYKDLEQCSLHLDAGELDQAWNYMSRAMRGLGLSNAFYPIHETITCISFAQRWEHGFSIGDRMAAVRVLSNVEKSLDETHDVDFENPVATYMRDFVSQAKTTLHNGGQIQTAKRYLDSAVAA